MPGFTTTILHSDRQSKIEHGAIHKPIHTSAAFDYQNAQDLVDVFQGKLEGYAYGRLKNPTVVALETVINQMEGGLESVCFATGMAAIGSTFFALLRPGDHVIASSFLFGNTHSLFNSFDSQGLQVSFVDATSARAVEQSIQPNTRLVFVETIANPRTQVADLVQIGELCAHHGLIYCVDNTMTSPYLYQPVKAGACLVINSLTKYIAGHGDVLGGSVTDTGHFDWTQFPNIQNEFRKHDPSMWGLAQIRKKGLRDLGASLDPDAAHRVAIGAETLAIRLERQCANAKALAKLLHKHQRVANVYYPGLLEHPSHELASKIFRLPGALFSFDLVQGIDTLDFLNKLKVAIRSTNLGDTRTLVIPVAQTIYHEHGEEGRKGMGISESLIRVSAGIEDPEDLLEDFKQALKG